MKMLARAVSFGPLLAAVAVADSPVGKAVQLLGDLQGKIIKEGESSHKVYGEFAEWCEEESRQLQHEIKTGKADVEGLKATIAQEDAKIKELEAELEGLSSDLATDEADLKAAGGIRTQEKGVFDSSEKELSSTTDMVKRAIGIIEKEMKGGASMMQLKNAGSMAQALSVLVEAAHISHSDAEKISSLVQTSAGDEADMLGAPAASVYESSSGNILQTLSDLNDKSEAQLDSVRKQETEDIHAFEMMELSLKNEIKNGKKEIAEAKQTMAAASEKKAKAEGDLQMTAKELASDEKGLGDLHHNCMTKAEEFEAETKSRAEELSALAAAKAALLDNTGGAESLSYGLNQVGFLQVRARTKITSRAALAGFEAVHLVRDLAKKQRDPALAQLAARMGAATGGSFDKIKGLIQDMLEKLEKEAEEDATKKAFCDKELAETHEKKEAKTTEIAKLSTSIDKMSSKSAMLKEQTAELQKALSALAKSQATMDKIRAEEKEAFTANKAEMDQGLKGVKIALKVLREYYAQGDKAHAAAEGAGGGVIGLLEVVESDFTKGLAEMTSDEESAADAYDTQSKENAIEKATKEQDVKYKVKESTELDKSVAETTSDRSGVQAELDAVLEYLSKIEEQCIAKAETHEERAARFAAEIAGLKQALTVLNEETAPALVQRRSLRKVRAHA